MRKDYRLNFKSVAAAAILGVSCLLGSGTASAADTVSPSTITPADGSTVEAPVSTIVLGNWGDGVSFGSPSPDAYPTNTASLFISLEGNGVTKELDFNSHIGLSMSPLAININLKDDAITEPGEYTVTMPEGFILFKVDGENVPNGEVSVTFNVIAAQPPVEEMVNIVDGEPFDLTVTGGMGASCNFQGEFVAPMTGILTVSFDPVIRANNSNRSFLYESDKETALEFSCKVNADDTGIESYSYEVSEGQTYYFLIGSYNPDNISLNAAAGTYSVTFSVSEGSDTPGGGDGEGDGGEDEPGDNEGINAYDFSAFTGSYNEISNGTIVMDWDIYYELQDEGMQPEDNSFKAVLMGANGELSCTTLPDAPTSLPGIPLGFEFEYAGNTFTHILISTSGYVMLGGENIGGILTGGTIMDGDMGKFVFQKGVPNVLGSVDTNSPFCLTDTEISYLASSSKMVVQYKNWGFAKTVVSKGVPVDMQIILYASGKIEIVYSGWSSLEPVGDNDYSGNQGPVYIALKGAGETMITLQGEDLTEAELIRDVDMPSITYINSTLPDGYTLTFTAPDFEEVYSVPSITSVTVDGASATVNFESEYDTNELNLTLSDGTEIISFSVTGENSWTFEELDPATYLVSVRGVVSEENEIFTDWSEAYEFTTESSAVNSLLNNGEEVEYYNLQGMKVAQPSNGIYLIKKGDKVSKVIIR